MRLTSHTVWRSSVCSVSISALARRRCASLSSPQPPFDVLFFGSDEVSLPTLRELHAAQNASPRFVRDLQVVVPREAGKHAVVSSWAVRQRLRVHQLATLKDWELPAAADTGLKPNLAIVASFGMFIPARIVNHFGGHTLNMHPSLLPKYRGAAPIYHAVFNGDTQSGITVLRIHPAQFDAGEVLYQTTYDMPENGMYQHIRSELGELGARSILHTLHNYSSLCVRASPQSHEGISLAPKIRREQTQLNWLEDTPQRVLRRFRAFADTFGVFTFLWDGRTRVKIEGMEAVAENSEPPGALSALAKLPAGQITFQRSKNRLLVSCKGGAVAVTQLKVEGRNKADAIAFANGYLKPKDAVFAFRFVAS